MKGIVIFLHIYAEKKCHGNKNAKMQKETTAQIYSTSMAL